jgi:hypothetical protein
MSSKAATYVALLPNIPVRPWFGCKSGSVMASAAPREWRKTPRCER